MYVGGNPPQTRKERLFHIKHESIDELIHFLFHKKKYVQILPIELLKKPFEIIMKIIYIKFLRIEFIEMHEHKRKT